MRYQQHANANLDSQGKIAAIFYAAQIAKRMEVNATKENAIAKKVFLVKTVNKKLFTPAHLDAKITELA